MLTNTTIYTPWESDKNGRQLGGDFGQVSVAASTDTTFQVNFYEEGTSTPYAMTDGALALCRLLELPDSGCGKVEGVVMAMAPSPGRAVAIAPWFGSKACAASITFCSRVPALRLCVMLLRHGRRAAGAEFVCRRDVPKLSNRDTHRLRLRAVHPPGAR